QLAVCPGGGRGGRGPDPVDTAAGQRTAPPTADEGLAAAGPPPRVRGLGHGPNVRGKGPGRLLPPRGVRRTESGLPALRAVESGEFRLERSAEGRGRTGRLESWIATRLWNY